jgi:hypothetical protein
MSGRFFTEAAVAQQQKFAGGSAFRVKHLDAGEVAAYQ